MKETYTTPQVVEHGSIVEVTRDLGQKVANDFIINNTDETQFGIPPHTTGPGDGGSRDAIINPLP